MLKVDPATATAQGTKVELLPNTATTQGTKVELPDTATTQGTKVELPDTATTQGTKEASLYKILAARKKLREENPGCNQSSFISEITRSERSPKIAFM